MHLRPLGVWTFAISAKKKKNKGSLQRWKENAVDYIHNMCGGCTMYISTFAIIPWKGLHKSPLSWDQKDYPIIFYHYSLHTGCGIHNQSAHVKAYYSLTSDLMVTKFHMGVLPTLVDKIMHNNFGSASIWPQQRLSSQVSQKYIEPTLKCQKKKNFCCLFTPKFLSFNNCFYGFKM